MLVLLRARPLARRSAHAARSFSAQSPVGADANRRVHETPVAAGCGARWMRWLGRASATQMYCALLFSANLVVRADPVADIYEVRRMHARVSGYGDM